MNVHFHAVIPDGNFVREDGVVRFERLGAPTDDELLDIVRRIAVSVKKLLRPRVEAGQNDVSAPDAYACAQGESVSALPSAPRDGELDGWRPGKKHSAFFEGFSLHAGVHVHEKDRLGLAQLVGYGARPMLSQERLSALPDGRLVVRLKRPLADGRQELVLEPVELLRRRLRWRRRRRRRRPEKPRATMVLPRVERERRSADLMPGCRGLSCCGGCSSTESTAPRTGEVTGPVRITHPFHPSFGLELDFVDRRPRWGEDRVFYRDRDGHLASLPARWTSAVSEHPCLAAGAGRSPFRAHDLLELAALLSELRP